MSTRTTSAASLEKRLAEVEARLAIIDLEATYARVWDTGDADGWADVFTSDGIFEIVELPDRPGRAVKGRAALAAFCREVNAATTGMHMMHLPRLTVRGNKASGGLYFDFWRVARASSEQTVQGRSSGHYDVTYAKTAKGWRMQKRVERPIVRTNDAFYGVG
ncbi:MAG: nuclear transport factor 2 family protein [Dehalococcoidia bacterium]|nr:nuclear transport factor 2 family protein [Dehalococcoidia bacterium]